MPLSTLWLQLGALLAYLGVTWLEYRRVRSERAPTRRQMVPLGIVAASLHGAALFPNLILPSGALNLNLGQSLSLFVWLAVMILLIASVWRPLVLLGLGVMPAAALVLLGQVVWTGSSVVPVRVQGSPYLLGHILVATTAYALLSLAAVQSVLLWVQERSLRLKHFGASFKFFPPLRELEGLLFQIIWTGFVLLSLSLLSGLLWVQERSLRLKHFGASFKFFPPLRELEGLLFQIIWTGFVLLSLSLLSGLLFTDQIFGRPFVWDHHTVLSLLAWAVFAILLWGRTKLGWRAQTAVRWTLSGYGIILLAYFGVKLVLEVILQRP